MIRTPGSQMAADRLHRSAPFHPALATMPELIGENALKGVAPPSSPTPYLPSSLLLRTDSGQHAEKYTVNTSRQAMRAYLDASKPTKTNPRDGVDMNV